MLQLGFRSGLMVPTSRSPDAAPEIEDVITEEAGLRPPHGTAPRVTMMFEEDELVAQGAPVARHRTTPDICFVAPMPARVARVSLSNGHRLSEVVLFREADGDVVTHDTSNVDKEGTLRRLIQVAGLWPTINRRPFGGMPRADERPAAIVIMARDTRPAAPDPLKALKGREEAFARGCHALRLLTDGPVFLCQAPDAMLLDRAKTPGIEVVPVGPRHPQGAAGLRIHSLFPASIERPVWDMHAEDVAALGDLVLTGRLPDTRLVHVGGPALKRSRLVRTQAGADLRGLTFRDLTPGAHKLWSGSSLDGHPARWLAPRDRQVTAMPSEPGRASPHWLLDALTRSASPKPVIPTAALDQAFGGTLPAAAFLRALSAGDDETAMKMGVLSLLEEDVALADYVLGGEAHLPSLLRGLLNRIKTELAA